MNLVAKEFVSARTDLRGVLVLSEFTGAARELTEALIVNPYDLEASSEALATALTRALALRTLFRSALLQPPIYRPFERNPTKFQLRDLCSLDLPGLTPQDSLCEWQRPSPASYTASGSQWATFLDEPQNWDPSA